MDINKRVISFVCEYQRSPGRFIAWLEPALFKRPVLATIEQNEGHLFDTAGLVQQVRR
jgi:hypothetical protein